MKNLEKNDIKKIVLKKNKINNNVFENKNNIKSYLSNYENKEKVNVINDCSVNSKSLRKMQINDDLIEQDNYKINHSIELNTNDKNMFLYKENEILKKDMIENNINENSKNSSKNRNTHSIYLEEDN